MGFSYAVDNCSPSINEYYETAGLLIIVQGNAMRLIKRPAFIRWLIITYKEHVEN